MQALKRQTEGNRDLEACLKVNATHMSKTPLQLVLVIATFLGKSLNLNIQIYFQFFFFTFFVFTKLLWNLLSKSYLFLTVVYKQVCYSFYTAFHFYAFFLLFFSTIIFLMHCYTSVNGTKSKKQIKEQEKKGALVKSNSKTFGIVHSIVSPPGLSRLYSHTHE